MEFSAQAKSVVGSLTLAIDAKAKEMVAQGENVVGFGCGEPDFDTPEFIKQAAKAALDSGKTKYTPATGLLELRKAICEKLQKDNSLSYSPGEIVVSNGAKHSLYNIFQAALNPGDEVIIPEPYWVSYPEMVKMCYGVPVYVPSGEENGFKATAADIARAITPKTKAIVINSPSNPSGCVYTPAELEEIAKLAVEKDLLVVSDEIYEKLLYDGNTHVSIASFGEEIKKRTVIVNGMSKVYAMTGWRIGYTASSKELAGIMGNCQSHATSNPNTIAQHASLAALKGENPDFALMLSEFGKRRDYMVKRINSSASLSCLVPGGAFYVMLNISKAIGARYGGKLISGSMDFASILLESKKVALVPGIAFGADKHVRLSYATSMENIQEGLARIEQFMSELE